MNEDFEDQLRRAIHSDDLEIRSDTEQAIRTGRRIVRGRRLGWGFAASALVVAAALVLPGMLQRTLPAVPADPISTVSANPAPTGVPVKLERTGWQVTSINGAAPVAERPPTLLFRDGGIHAATGCNGISGWYSQDGDRLTMTGMGMSLMLCQDPAIMLQEKAVSDALNSVTGAVVEGGRLHLLDAAGATVLEAIPDSALLLAAEKSTWRLDNSSGLWGKGEQTSITLRVERHRLSGRSGCGDYTADFTHNGNSWSIPSATREPVPCPSAAGLPADRFLGLLEKVTRVELDHNQLRLISPTETLYFTRD